MHFSVKIQRQPTLAALGCHPFINSRIFSTNRLNGQHLLADSGSDLSCYPHKLLPGIHNDAGYNLEAANQSTIKTYGLMSVKIDIGFGRTFTWNFTIADVSVPIIRADFFAHYKLLLDCGNKRLLDSVSGIETRCLPCLSTQTSVKVIRGSISNCFATILDEFPALTRPRGAKHKVEHSTVHFIRTTHGPPITCRPRRLAPDRLQFAIQEFKNRVQEGAARSSDGAWSSPLHMAPKKPHGRRACGDYRALNARTITDKYPVRHIHDFNSHLRGCKIFSTIDLVKAYTQIPVNPEDIVKLFINNTGTHGGIT